MLSRIFEIDNGSSDCANVIENFVKRVNKDSPPIFSTSDFYLYMIIPLGTKLIFRRGTVYEDISTLIKSRLYEQHTNT